jgi:hypothetical protein
MVHYVYVYGRQHGITTDTTQQHIELLEQAIKHNFGESAQCHGVCYYQDRIRPHPSWLRKKLVYACAGEKGSNLLNQVWYSTWIFRINLKIEDLVDKESIRALLGLHMKVERIDFIGRGPNETTKRIRALRDKIIGSAYRPVNTRDISYCRYFGKRFSIGRDIL